MKDPIGSHPTRAEQLDILVTIIAEMARPGDAILDLGCGTGYLEHLLLAARNDIFPIGVDRNLDSLATAAAQFGTRAAFVRGDLTALDAIKPPRERCRFAVTALTFHDLSDVDKQAVLAWMAAQLEEDGVILIYDRLRLTEPSLFAMQRAIWNRIERINGRAMRTAATFAAYEADLSETNRPARLCDYETWFEALGFGSQILHLHGNVALIGAARR
ncbi:MAG: class I SAM-dependent methyltransferase [Alphaproteobacteria bacterium]|nr:class I SAM-dependent methyltransferase [Alphaproteobacteria bacterium]